MRTISNPLLMPVARAQPIITFSPLLQLLQPPSAELPISKTPYSACSSFVMHRDHIPTDLANTCRRPNSSYSAPLSVINAHAAPFSLPVSREHLRTLFKAILRVVCSLLAAQKPRQSTSCAKMRPILAISHQSTAQSAPSLPVLFPVFRQCSTVADSVHRSPRILAGHEDAPLPN